MTDGRWAYRGRMLEAVDIQKHRGVGLVVVGRDEDGTVVSFCPKPRVSEGLLEPRTVG